MRSQNFVYSACILVFVRKRLQYNDYGFPFLQIICQKVSCEDFIKKYVPKGLYNTYLLHNLPIKSYLGVFICTAGANCKCDVVT